MGKPPIDKTQPIAVLGAGAWGTTLAIVLARSGRPVLLWGSDEARMARLAHERAHNTRLPGIRFPDSLEIESDLSRLVKRSHQFLIVVPSGRFRAVLRALAPHFRDETVIAWATKGFEPNTHKRLSEVSAEVLPRWPATVITGPSFAYEVATGLPAALTVASTDAMTAETVATWFRSDRLRIYTANDVIGAEVAGAVKNVLAIAAGISDGLGFGANARAALITRGLAELMRLGVALGGHTETLMGLAGVGDLILTCTDNLSRNRRVGLALGAGRTLADIVSELGQAVEGIASTREIVTLARIHHIDMPITDQVHAVLFEGRSPHAAVDALLHRHPKAEQ